MALDIFTPKHETIKVFIAFSDLAWAMETNLIPDANTRLVINPVNGDYGFYSFGDNAPPGWFDCGPIPQYPILEVRSTIARDLFPNASWDNCPPDQLPPEVEALSEDPVFLRSWRGAAFSEDYTPYTVEESPVVSWIAALAEEDIEVTLMRG